MRHELPSPHPTVLKRAESLPLSFWQHLGDPLADLLCTIYPVAAADTLQALICYEASQGQPLCQQFLAQGELQPTHWQDARYQPALQAWLQFAQQQSLQVRWAWQLGVGLRCLSQTRWQAVWSVQGITEFLRGLDELLLAPTLPATGELQRLRLQWALWRLQAEESNGFSPINGVACAQTDIAGLLHDIAEILPASCAALGAPMSGLQHQGLRHWCAGLMQKLGLEAHLVANTPDEALALHAVLSGPADAAAGTAVTAWLDAIAARDPLPAARRRLHALCRSVLPDEAADSLGIDNDRLASLWQRAGSWVRKRSSSLGSGASGWQQLQHHLLAR